MSIETVNNYEEQKEIAIKAWNIAADINRSIESFKEKYKDNKKQAAETFYKAMNNMITILFTEEKVQSIRQALMIIAADLQDKCNDFPKSDRELSKHVDEENTKRLIQKMATKESELLRNQVIEESSSEQLPTAETVEDELIQEDIEDKESTEAYTEEQDELNQQDQQQSVLTELTELELFENIRYRPKPNNVWNFQLDHRFGFEYPGQIPAGIVFNTLYFFTKPGDIIVDPMAGGGVVGDCCKEVKRRCIMYDINPDRPDIIKNDIQKGLPKEAENADLLFWDPPYWKKKEQEYANPDGSISSLPMKQYMSIFENAAKDFYKKGIKKIAFLMSDHIYTEGAPNTFIWDYVRLFEKAGYKATCHIHCPLSTEQVHNHEKLIEERKMWGISRSLVIFEK